MGEASSLILLIKSYWIVCGNGYHSYELAVFARAVCAIYISGEAIEYTKRYYSRPNLNFIRMDSLDLQAPNAYSMLCVHLI